MTQIDGFNTKGLAVLTTTQLSGLVDTQLAGLTTTQVKALTTTQIVSLDPVTQLDGLDRPPKSAP